MIISNNLIGKMDIPKGSVIRINLAWVSDFDTAQYIIGGNVYGNKWPIYLDYPSGRTKPPKPTIPFKDAVKLALDNDNVKYFAISNAENIDLLAALQLLMPNKIIVPKIETVTGVEKLDEMIEVGITTVMLDKEDLYVNVQADSDEYEELIDKVRKSGLKVLELQGVVFNEE